MREMEGCKTGVERGKLGRVRGNKNEEGWDYRVGKDTESPELALNFFHTAHHHAQFCLTSPVHTLESATHGRSLCMLSSFPSALGDPVIREGEMTVEQG